MDSDIQPPTRAGRIQTNWILAAVSATFLVMAGLFVANLWGRTAATPKVPLVDVQFLDPAPWRQTYTDLAKAKEDLSDFDCYGCHEKKKPPVIEYDEKHNIVLPKEHSNLKLGHGSHNRNNVCYNCHNEQNLVTFQARDGRELKFQDSTALCGSCHGPTYRDWEAGVHGRTSGYWDRSRGELQRLNCANCHDPHSPRIPTRAPAPPPRGLHEPATGPTPTAH
ncbi:MAG: hypothetical protein Q7S40_26380 [Opitutaceae bacterium]|nr:hypothetical protein [Opitutaceae bacterium]